MHPPHAPLLGLARLCPCVLLFPLLCDLVESQFLHDGVLPTGRVSAVGGFVHSFSWFRFLSATFGLFSSVPLSLLPSLRCVGSPLLRRVFLEVSLPLLVAGWRSRLRLFCFSSSFLRLSPLRGFLSYFLLQLSFSLVLFPYSCCSPINFL